MAIKCFDYRVERLRLFARSDQIHRRSNQFCALFLIQRWAFLFQQSVHAYTRVQPERA